MVEEGANVNDEAKAILKALKFVLGLGEAREELLSKAAPASEGCSLELRIEVEAWDGKSEPWTVMNVCAEDIGGLLEDPRKALGEDYERLQKIVHQLETAVALPLRAERGAPN